MQWSRLLLAGINWNVVRSLQEPIGPWQVERHFMFCLYDVGLAPGAVLWVNITDAPLSHGTVLVVLSHRQWHDWLRDRVTPLPTGTLGPDSKPLATFSSYMISNWRQPLVSRLVANYTLRAAKPDRYYVGILNVNEGAWFVEGKISYVNPGGQHLPLQLAHFPDLLWISSNAFGALMMAASLLLTLRSDATMLHALLCGCVWLKSVELALQGKFYLVLAREGVASLWRRQTCQLVSKLHEVFQIGLLLLTALGWRMLRPRLTSVEMRFLTSAVGLALLLAVLQVGSESTGSDVGPVSFRLLFYIVKVMCYLVIIFAMNFNLQVINVHLAESPVTAAVAVYYRKQEAFMILRRVFLALVFRPSVLLWLQLSVLNQVGTEWLVSAIDQAWGWLIYVGLFAALWPGSQNRLLRLVLASEVTQFADIVANIRRDQAGRAGGPPEHPAGPPWQQPGAEGVPVFGQAAAAVAAVASAAVGNLDGDLTAPYIPLASGD